MVEKRARADSNISDIDLSDREHCILCMNTIVFFALGKCNHKNVCHKCVLRVRLLMDDKSCSICKTECEEIVISRDPDLLWEDVCDK